MRRHCGLYFLQVRFPVKIVRLIEKVDERRKNDSSRAFFELRHVLWSGQPLFMASVCVLTLCGLPAAGKTTFATSFKDYLQRDDIAPLNKSGFAESQNCSDSLSYRVIHIDYDELIPSGVNISVSDHSDDSEHVTVIIILIHSVLL